MTALVFFDCDEEFGRRSRGNCLFARSMNSFFGEFSEDIFLALHGFYRITFSYSFPFLNSSESGFAVFIAFRFLIIIFALVFPTFLCFFAQHGAFIACSVQNKSINQ